MELQSYSLMFLLLTAVYGVIALFIMSVIEVLRDKKKLSTGNYALIESMVFWSLVSVLVCCNFILMVLALLSG